MHKINFEIMIHRINNNYCEIFTFSICMHPYFFFRKKSSSRAKSSSSSSSETHFILTIDLDKVVLDNSCCYGNSISKFMFCFHFPCRDINKFDYINWLQAKFEHCFSFNKDLIGNLQLPQAFLQWHLCCHMEIYHSWLQRILRCS